MTRPVDEAGPLIDLVPVRDPWLWIREGEGLVAWGSAVRIEPGAGPARFGEASRRFAELAADASIDDEVARPGTGLVAVGSFTFDDHASGSLLVVPRIVVGRRDGVTWLTRIELPDASDDIPGPARQPLDPLPRDRPRYAGSSKPDLHWLEAVAEAIEEIRAGRLEKVVLARDLAVWSRQPFDTLDLARRLTARFPGCHTFLAEDLVGATPELLLSRRGPRVSSRVLAGTAGRGHDDVEDAELGAQLLGSAKDRHEHELAAASVQELLAPHCSAIAHDPEPQLLRLDNVQHLATTFEGELSAPIASLDLVGELHPTAAVGGTPRAVAIEVIRELEGMERGRYAAPVGWTDAEGDGEWGIALRCAELSGARARLFAGVGIVAASLPEAELEETRLKLNAMQVALGPEVV